MRNGAHLLESGFYILAYTIFWTLNRLSNIRKPRVSCCDGAFTMFRKLLQTPFKQLFGTEHHTSSFSSNVGVPRFGANSSSDTNYLRFALNEFIEIPFINLTAYINNQELPRLNRNWLPAEHCKHHIVGATR